MPDQRYTHSILAILILLLVSGINCCGQVQQELLPAEAIRVTWFVDPAAGADTSDGKSPATPKKTLNFTQSQNFRAESGTKIALKCGSVTRLDKTLDLHGNRQGWVVWGSYGQGPKPIVIGSAAITQKAWQISGKNLLALDWSSHIDTGERRSADGVEQAPGNLWFFASEAIDAPMVSWGWRKQKRQLEKSGDWFYDAPAKRIYLFWTEPIPPKLTEAAINRGGISFKGQLNVILENWDLRYFGNYVVRGHSATEIRLRNLDISFSGGGTKNAQYVRLGNGMETTGNDDDVIVENCRFYQIFDTAFDPQDVGNSAISQSNLIYRNNIVSHMGLAGMGLWARTRDPGSRLHHVVATNNVFLFSGRGWGYEQHDHDGTCKCGADVVLFNNNAVADQIVIRNNVFHGSRIVLMSEWGNKRKGNQAIVRGADIDENIWSYTGKTAVALVQGNVDKQGTASPDSSVIIFEDLPTWKANPEAPGKDKHSCSQTPGFVNAIDKPEQGLSWIATAEETERPTRFGPFAFRGDYRRVATSH